MAENKASEYQQNVFKWGDAVLAYCKQNESKGQGVLIILYGLMTHFSDKGNPQIDEIVKETSGLPIAFHTQAIRVFNSKYSVSVLHINGGKMNNDIVAAKDLLMEESKNFNKATNRIPSPLEVIYLTVNHIVAHPEDNAKERTLFLRLMGDTKAQRLVVEKYVDAFEEKYRDDLMKGIY